MKPVYFTASAPLIATVRPDPLRAAPHNDCFNSAAIRS